MKKKKISTYRLLQLGISRKTLYNLQHGKNVTLETVDKLCQALDCGVSDVVIILHDR